MNDTKVQISGNVKIEFTAQGISYVLDMLANCPWKNANTLITEIMTQLKSQETVGVKDNGAS